MTNIIQFNKARPVLGQKEDRKMWVCNNCSSQWFWLYEGGDIQCATCDAHQTIRTFFPEEKP